MTERAVDLLATRDSSGHTCGEGNLTDKPYAPGIVVPIVRASLVKGLLFLGGALTTIGA